MREDKHKLMNHVKINFIHKKFKGNLYKSMPHKLLTLNADILQFVSSLSENGVKEAGIRAGIEGGTSDVIL